MGARPDEQLNSRDTQQLQGTSLLPVSQNDQRIPLHPQHPAPLAWVAQAAAGELAVEGARQLDDVVTWHPHPHIICWRRDKQASEADTLVSALALLDG